MNSNKLSELPIHRVDIEQKEYPENLRDIPSPPKALYYRGSLTKSLLSKTIAVVGSRKMTKYGQSVVEKFVSAFSMAGVTVISGFMYGIDTTAHEATLANGGKTIAVLGSGLNQIYPPENIKLYTEIVHGNGAILSDQKSEDKAKLWTFAKRNRIVSGLATLGVLVVEAGDKSGSLLTAEYGRKQNKKIYAVPGPITSTVSSGTNFLIKSGRATMVTDPSDILGEAYNANEKAVPKTQNPILNILMRESMSMDELSAALNKTVVEVSMEITKLSLQGKVQEAGGVYYVSDSPLGSSS